jgi:hypothetical protein
MRIAVRKMKKLARGALAAGIGGIALAAAQASQPPVPQADAAESIIVTGTKPTPEEARRRAVEFVRGSGVATSQRPVARWDDPVCPSVLGLQSTYAEMVETRLRSVAKEAGIGVAREPCRPNIVVSFASDANAVVRRVATRAPRRLEEVPAGARAALLDSAAPVRWWYSTDVRSRDGQPARAAPPPWTAGNAEGGGSMLPASMPSLQHYESTIISTQSARVLRAATVVIDVERVEGMSLDAIASYAALVAFAEIRASDFSPSGSILGLFEGESRLRELTEWDMAFLSALYRLPLDRTGRRHRGILVRELVAAETGE